MTDGVALVNALAPGPRELATLASLARRVEPQLLRALRLQLAPRCSAADEADVWFSPIVESAGATGLVLIPEVLPGLQRRLAEDPLRRLDSVWHLIFRLRTGVPFTDRAAVEHSTWLLVQEELTWWAVRGAPARAEDRERIATLFAWVRNSLTAESTARDAAAWIKSARLRLPAQAWALPGAARLSTAADTLNRSRSFWVRRVEEGVELSEQALAGGHPVPTSAQKGPLRVDVIARGDPAAEAHTLLVDNGIALVPVAARSVNLVLPDGRIFALDAAPHDPDFGGPAWRAQRIVVIHQGQAQWTGILLSPRHVLTCAHAIGTGELRVEIRNGRDGYEMPEPLFIPARTSARSPFDWLPPLPSPFGDAADDLAILRLARPAGQRWLYVDTPVVGLTQPVVGATATIYGGAVRAAGEPTTQHKVLTETIVSAIGDGGYEIELRNGKLLPGSSGAPVWLSSGELLGVLSGVREMPQRVALVAPARPLQSLLGGIRQRVLVAGSGTRDLPDQVWRIAQSLGAALAQAGHVLVCGGWPGVDYVVADAFCAALGDDAALPSRIVQHVERGSSPDFKLNFAPIVVNPKHWAQEMVQEVDAVVALGGLGGTLAICQAAIAAGVPVLPVPGTGGDAKVIYDQLLSHEQRQPFPDRHAVRAIEGNTAKQDMAHTIADRLIELLGDCFDAVRILRYRQSAAALCVLMRESGTGLTPAAPKMFMSELIEAAESTALPEKSDDAVAMLRATLPSAAFWLIRDLLRIDPFETQSSVRAVQAALLEAVLLDEQASERVARAMANGAFGTVSVERVISVWQYISNGKVSRALSVAASRFFARIETLGELGRALDSLLRLAREFLQPVDMKTFGKTHRRLRSETSKVLSLIDDDVTKKLLTSGDAARRTLGYVRFMLAPSDALFSVLAQSLQLETKETFTTHETRPLWLFLRCLMSVFEFKAFRDRLTPQMLAELNDLLSRLAAQTDADPGRECTHLLADFLERLKRGQGDEHFASYARRSVSNRVRERFAWCVFIDAPRARLDAIAAVEYVLDPTYLEKVRRVTDASHCFALQSEGWGEFTLRIRVFYRSGRSIEQSFALKLKEDAWPLGPAYSGPHGDPPGLVCAALCDPRWDWRTEPALAQETGLSLSQLHTVLADLSRGNFVRKAPFLAENDRVLWGATAKVGVLPDAAG